MEGAKPELKYRLQAMRPQVPAGFADTPVLALENGADLQNYVAERNKATCVPAAVVRPCKPSAGGTYQGAAGKGELWHHRAGDDGRKDRLGVQG